MKTKLFDNKKEMGMGAGRVLAGTDLADGARLYSADTRKHDSLFGS